MRYGRLNLSTSLLALGGIALLSAPQAASAQTIDPEVDADGASVGPEARVYDAPIIVTAQRREEAQLDVPISITTIDQAALETANVNALSDISKLTPALRFDAQNQFVQPTIRGIGTAITTSGGGSNVGIYVDGFYSPNPAEADFDLLNVESVQVLKGPQGTLFGRNTTGGAILVDTADPSTETGAAFKASYARYNQIRSQAYVTTGITDDIAFDIEGLYATGDAFQRNVTTGNRDREYRNWQVRLGLKAQLTDDISAKLRYQHIETDDPRPQLLNIYVDPDLGPGTLLSPGTYTTDKDKYQSGADRSTLTTNSEIVQLTVEADLGFADLTSYTQYRQQDVDSSLDLDKTGVTIFQLGLPVINKTWTQEFLMTSKPGPELQWTAGLFYLYNSDRYITFSDNAVSAGLGRFRIGGSKAPTRSYAAFFDATYEVSPQFFVTAGIRYAHDTVEDAYYNPQDGSGDKIFVKDLKDDTFTPRLVLRYKPDDSSSIYASYTRGYKAGILDVGGSTGDKVNPEKIDAFELGYKYSDGPINFETAAFYYDYRNLQVSLFSGDPPSARIINAASSEIYGLEAQLTVKPTSRLTLNAGASYVHGRYTDFPDAPVYRTCPAPVTAPPCGGGDSFYVDPTDLKNVDMQRTPEFTGNIGASYLADLAGGSLMLSGNFYYTSEFSFAPSGIQFPGGDYEVLSLRAEWTDPSDKFHFAVFGDNVTNSRYVTQVQYNTFGIGSTWSEPVTYGAEFGFRF